MLLLGSAATRSHGSGSRHRSRQGSTPYDWLLPRSWRPSRRGASLSAGESLHGAELQRTRAVPQRCALLPTGCAPQSPIEQALRHPQEHLFILGKTRNFSASAESAQTVTSVVFLAAMVHSPAPSGVRQRTGLRTCPAIQAASVLAGTPACPPPMSSGFRF